MSEKFVVFISLLMAIAYTTQAFEKIAHVTSIFGEVCYDSCEKHGGSYYYCHSRSGWDYCSPSLNVDHHGKACKSDHPCGKHGLMNRWCNSNADSGWGYCGDVERKLTRYTSRYKKLCLDDCAYDASKKYYYCITSGSADYDYCSPVPNVSYKNKTCKADHPCGLHGKNYYWCHTDDSWDYCGLVERDTCDGKALWKRSKRSNQPVDRHLCIVDLGNNVEVNYLLLPGDRISTNEITRQRRVEANWAIREFRNGMLTTRARTLAGYSNWRLDMQGIFNRDGQQYYNIQLQLNVKRRGASDSTTYAIVLVPDGYLAANYTKQRRIRNALLTSLEKTKKILIEVRRRPRRHDELRRSLTAAMKPNFERFEEIFARGNSTTLDI